MSTTLKIYINHDAQDLPLGSSGVDWIEIDPINDFFVFSAGSSGVVADNAPLPSSSDLNQAAVLIRSTDVIVPKYFLADMSENKLREIKNAGDQNKRYVIAFSFDGATATEPTLQCWDTSDMDSKLFCCLGEGISSNSWIRGIATTNGLPGENWIGSRLAGSSSGNYLLLNNGLGALNTAKDLFCNIKVIIPGNFSRAKYENPVFVCRWSTN